MKGSVQSVEVSYFVHATEDEERIQSMVAETLSPGVSPETYTMKGHYGNNITGVRFHVTGSNAGELFSRICKSLHSDIKAELRRSLHERMDEHLALYIRLDKQKLVRGRLGEALVDPVKIRVKPNLFLLRGGVEGFYRRTLGA